MLKYGILILCALILFSCKKNGTGGEAMITAYVNHKGNPVNLPTIYVKYGAKTQPSSPTTDYDQVIQGVHENHVHIKYLRYGNYYLYATGFDSIANRAVSGGLAVKVKWSKRKLETEAYIEASD